jgi:GrpB-like predicted nucleotidyltransferase (UPF0157 family)
MPESQNTSAESLNESSRADSEKLESAAFTPSTEEQILAAHMGNPVPQYVPVKIVDYNPEWPRLYEREAARVRSALGDRILSLEHVGSTSVPGLAAKPIIDMQLVVANTADEPSYVPALEAAGYVLTVREPEWYEHRMFKGPDTNINLHVLSSECSEIDRRFRSSPLRTHQTRTCSQQLEIRPELRRCQNIRCQ